MKRVTIITAIALFGLGGLAAGLALGDRSQPTEPTAAAPVAPAPASQDSDDPCAEYIAQGIACEFVAFPEMEIKPSGGPEVARR